MPKQLKTGFHWGPACVNIKIEYREYGNPRGNSLPAPQFRGNQVYKLRRSAQEKCWFPVSRDVHISNIPINKYLPVKWRKTNWTIHLHF